jgi:hypothetical protein
MKYSLRSLMIVVSLVCVIAGWWRLATTKVDVSGMVTYHGEPVYLVKVLFVSTNETCEPNYEGDTDIEGRFRLKTPAQPGLYHVLIAIPRTEKRKYPPLALRESWSDLGKHQRRIWPTATSQEVIIEVETP